ncbi:MAG: tetratricopeptide repeat protein [Deltaproteobacteria bacterium]|nr:tetratricopeptide repeat protein [Deltaproteobacteria bacterium]
MINNKLNIILQNVILFTSLLLVACVPMEQPRTPEEMMLVENKLVELLIAANTALESDSKNDLGDAEAALKIATALKSDDVRVQDALGCLALKQGDLEQAKFYFQQALALDNTYDPAYAHLAMIAERNNDLLIARQLYLLALQHNPLNYQARNNYAVFLVKHSKHSAEIRKFAQQELLAAQHSYDREGTLVKKNLKKIKAQDNTAHKK